MGVIPLVSDECWGGGSSVGVSIKAIVGDRLSLNGGLESADRLSLDGGPKSAGHEGGGLGVALVHEGGGLDVFLGCCGTSFEAIIGAGLTSLNEG